MRTRILAVSLLVVAGLVLPDAPARAEDARVLPGGVLRVRARPFYLSFRERWNPQGQSEPIGTDLDDRDLTSEVFPDLEVMERFYHMPAGSLTAGRSGFASHADVYGLGLAAELGLTDVLTVGVVVPILSTHTRVDRLTLRPGNLGRNPGDGPVSRSHASILPVDHDADRLTPEVSPLGVDGVQDLLEGELGYRRLGDRSRRGVGDIEVGFKALLLPTLWANPVWHAAVQAGVRLPTGAVDDPDDLMDLPHGDGQTDLVVALLSDLYPMGRDGLRANVSLRYTNQLPDRQRLRVPADANLPIAGKDAIEEVRRDLGDWIEVDLGLYLPVASVLTVSGRYLMVHKWKDRVEGDLGLSYDALTAETALEQHLVEAGVGFSTLPWVARDGFPVPLDITLAAQVSVAGRGNAPRFAGVTLEIATYLPLWGP